MRGRPITTVTAVNTMLDEPDVTVRDLASYFGVTVQTIRRWQRTRVMLNHRHHQLMEHRLGRRVHR